MAVDNKLEDDNNSIGMNIKIYRMKKGYSQEVAEEIYEYIIKFANYGFNKAHSVAYSVIAYYTAFLKCHFSYS